MNRRDFLRNSSAAAVFAALPFISTQSAVAVLDPLKSGTLPLSPSNDVELGGFFGQMYELGLKRLTQEPLNTDFVLADVNFNQKRWFTNFSGDISGRFLEICSCSRGGHRASGSALPQPECLEEVIDRIVTHQKADGHFGADVNWWANLDLLNDTDNAVMMPILWGNGRLLLGLTAAWDAFRKEATLTAAKKLGDFYVNIVVPRFCDPKRLEEYSVVSPGYASAYVTCVYEGMEGLVQLYRATKEKKYLDCAVRMGRFHENFDVLPVRHSHGSLSEHEGLMMIYEETGDRYFLNRVEKRWEDAVSGGYVNVCGSVLEKFWVTDDRRDEGCSEADWLRLNLMLWRSTGKEKYLDMAERLLWNGYVANQWVSGGFGHRFLGIDEKGPFSYQNYSQESLWCCSYHGPLGLYDFKRYLAVAINGKIQMNFLQDFKAPLEIDGKKWLLSSKFSARNFIVKLDGPKGAAVPFTVRKPSWAKNLRVKFPCGKDADLSKPLAAGTTLHIQVEIETRLETRRLKKIENFEKGLSLSETAIFLGPKILVAKEGDGKKIEDLNMTFCDGKLIPPEDALTTFHTLYFNETERLRGHSFLFNLKIE
ncbi:MAG: glycoside hydrolase family 127 protein [Thermoguttaceae bacterium]|nr:glycoside hydrolase family 127 protein [Thermoguttaceae bacterium]